LADLSLACERREIHPGAFKSSGPHKIPTQTWTANVAFFQLLLFAYNLVHWFKRLCLPQEYFRATVETIRDDFLVLPGKLNLPRRPQRAAATAGLPTTAKYL